jgi:hypothetical protein
MYLCSSLQFFQIVLAKEGFKVGTQFYPDTVTFQRKNIKI